MRKHILAAGIAAVALIPSLASAQETCEQRSANRAAGTAVGAVAGALLGSAVAGRHDRGTGAVVGGVGGAIVGNQLARGDRDCVHAYGWYDNDGRWHGQRVEERYATGYYDRNGDWVDGRPAGHWDSGIYVADAGAYGANAAYVARDHTLAIDARIAQMDEWIDRNKNTGRLSYREARDAQNTLNDIRREYRYRMADGRVGGRDADALQDRLDQLADRIRYDRRD
ncbi:MAG TPA: glycine zipper 2TM domain-containing protein [Phenylobacterium sp.]